MDFYDAVEIRRSARSYRQTPVEKEKLYRILESSTLTPSWSCKHCWRLLIVDDSELKNQIAECVNDTNPAQKGILEAPVVVVICADPVNAEEIDGREYYMADCGIVMEHFMLSASSEGLSTCWVGLFDEDKLKQLLNVPELVRVVAISPLGYNNERLEPRKGKGIKDIAYLNKWENDMLFH